MWKKGRESIGKQRKSETAIQAQQKPHPTPWGAPELVKAVLRLPKWLRLYTPTSITHWMWAHLLLDHWQV